MRFRITFVALWLTAIVWTSHAQTAALSRSIDSLFQQWNTPNHPGGAIGVMQGDQIIYSQAFGLASLEYLVPNSPGMLYNTGSVSKQFTSMGIVLLEEKGLLSFNDDIRKYIPELPDFGQKITIRQMMHHTSGLRSLHMLFALAGWRSDDSRTNADLNRLMLNQKDLNFEPGSEYLYCNTGYMLMVNIIEKVTGQEFTGWMKENVFNPLGMYQTYAEDVYSRVVPNNATSYYAGKSFERAVEYWGYIGSGNMHSTTADLLTYLKNYYQPQAGWASAFEKMKTLDPLNDGTPNNYAFGVILDSYLGHDRVQHGGSIGGFRAHVAVYPKEKLSIVVLTNFSSSNPALKSNQIAGLILDPIETPAAPKEDFTAIRLTTTEMQQMEGSYWDARLKTGCTITLKNDTLRYSTTNGKESPLIAVAKDELLMQGAGAHTRIKFTSAKGTQQITFTTKDKSPAVYARMIATAPTAKELKEYAGKYYSDEVETFYKISVEGDKLYCYQPRHGKMPIVRAYKDVLIGEDPLGAIEIRRSKSGAITGILMSNGRARNMWFAKTE